MATASRPAFERDPVKLDPKHYKVELENDRFRIVRITYGPNEKSPMHQHLPGVAIMLTDADFKFTYPDGRAEEFHKKAGEFMSSEELWEHHPENLTNKTFQALFIELKK
jgi:predicted metal-dependent enzyme (double-stranded beta helix superfamily)